jgi:spermidine/putrescine transport system substrate-binding protein
MGRRRLSSFPAAALSRRGFLGRSLAVATVLPVAGRAAFAQEQSVNVYNWDTYIGENTLDEFTDQTGIAVRYDLFASNDELFAKLREGNPGYDVIFPSNNFVERMIVAKMLEPLDHAKIPNLANLSPRFQNPDFDPGLKYSAAYFWGTQGLGYRMSAAEPAAWADIMESDKYAGRVALLNDTDIIRMALKYLGHSLNSSDPAEITAAQDALIKAKPNFKAFAPDTGQDLLISGEVDVCMEWSGDITQVMSEDDDLSYVVPREGSLLWVDNMAIPVGAPHVDNAHTFINFILEPQVHADIAMEVRFALPNAKALELLPAEDRDNRVIYPDEATLAKCEFAIYKGEEIEGLYETALTRVLSA